MPARAHTARADSWTCSRAPPATWVNGRELLAAVRYVYEAWDRGKGAVLDPAVPRPGASPPRCQICQASRSCAAVTSPNPVLCVSSQRQNGSLCCLWRRHPAWIGHHRGDTKGGPITVRSHHCYALVAPAPGRKGLYLATQASPWAHCELFHHPSVDISADGRQRYNRNEPQLVGPKVLCRLASLPPCLSPFAATPRSAGSSSHATRFTVNERAAAV